ncbi:MAG: hypothetical protein ACLR7D_15170 [Lachnospira eligens]
MVQNTGHDLKSVPQDMPIVPKMTIGNNGTLVGMDMPVSAIRAQISSAIDIIVHLARLRDKSRKVVQIAEVGNCINGEIVLTPLFKFVENSQDKHGKLIGTLVRQNNVFNRTEKLKAAGFSEWGEQCWAHIRGIILFSGCRHTYFMKMGSHVVYSFAVCIYSLQTENKGKDCS